MAKSKVSFDTVRKLGLALDGVEETTSYGKAALRVGGKMMVCVPSHKSAEPDSLVVRVSFEERAELIAAAPETYYVTDHYAGYPSVLVRLPRIDPDALRDLLKMAWRFAALGGKRRDSKGRV
jgi:hypothetical protein